MPGRDLHRGNDILTRPRNDDAERFNLIDAGVSGVQRPRDRVESNFTGDVLFEFASQRVWA